MTNLRLTTMCVIWIQGTIACGSSTSDAITGDSSGSGGRGDAGMSGGANNAGTGGGGSPTSTGGAGGATAGSGGTSGSSGGVATGGSKASGGATSNGGSTADGGPSGSGGASGDGGVVCQYIHPNVNGAARTCNSGFCYCSGTDGCYTAATASSCCKEQVVCGPGAQNPVATIFHPGSGETRAANVDIPFSGVGTDPQDGDLTGASLVWTSSLLSTPIGTGKTFNAPLPAGTHVITLTATDSNSNTGTDTITLDIQ